MIKISSYTTCREALKMDYPIRECIESCLQFADEMIVLDSTENDSDGTTSLLNEMATKDARIKHIQKQFDWNAPNSGIYDGISKAFARSQCTGTHLYQIDLDEIVHEKHADMIRPFIEKVNWKETKLVALPVIDLWGKEKIRIEVNPWKWRLSINDPAITHGIPVQCRVMKNGLLYATPGTDGCDYIHSKSGQVIPCSQYMTSKVDQVRRLAVTDETYIPQYEKWFNASLEQLPAVFHYSWYDIKRKVYNFKHFWARSWQSLYGDFLDERNNPMFPGRLWNEVTDEEIAQYAKKLETETNGHVFHRPWDGTKTNGIKISLGHPANMKEWIARQK